MCPDRVSAGKPTACAEICPTGATKFGERDELIAEAQQRIRYNPGQYVPHIYGVNEVGGTSVLLLSSVPFEQFGYRADLTRDPLPMYTYRVLSRIPDFVPLGGMMLAGIWWITHRREEVAAAEGPQATKVSAKKESEQ
jgi:formate dehydrogenase iron-sulfur subunit